MIYQNQKSGKTKSEAKALSFCLDTCMFGFALLFYYLLFYCDFSDFGYDQLQKDKHHFFIALYNRVSSLMSLGFAADKWSINAVSLPAVQRFMGKLMGSKRLAEYSQRTGGLALGLFFFTLSGHHSQSA